MSGIADKVTPRGGIWFQHRLEEWIGFGIWRFSRAYPGDSTFPPERLGYTVAVHVMIRHLRVFRIQRFESVASHQPIHSHEKVGMPASHITDRVSGQASNGFFRARGRRDFSINPFFHRLRGKLDGGTNDRWLIQLIDDLDLGDSLV